MVQSATAYFTDLRDFLATLEEHGKLVRVKGPVNKDTELNAVVRIQYRGLPESERKAFLFENVFDGTGRRFAMPVVVGCMAASHDVYALGMKAEHAGQIPHRWAEARQNPIAPVVVESGPVHENVYTGDELERIGGVSILPVPISTPGFDNAPYTSAGAWVSRDPETGRYNVGTYRGQIKAPLRVGASSAPNHDMFADWKKYRARREPMPAALVLGPTPNIAYVATAVLPDDVDEYHVAGGIAGSPVELVKCKTHDLLVPAHAEIVVEGFIPLDELEPEGPFGEFTGYMALTKNTLFMNVTAITHRNDAILHAFFSQFPPSESSILRGVGRENVIWNILTKRGMTNIRQVALHESSGSWGMLVIQVKDPEAGQARQIFEAIPAGIRPKIVVVVDDDIDPLDADSVNWALSYRFQPNRDIEVAPGGVMVLDPSLADPEDVPHTVRNVMTEGQRISCLLMDATRKWAYPPTSLPKREYMERALEIWEREGLPPVKLKAPWHGENLGFWPAERELEAELAVQGRYFETGEKFAQRRVYLEPEQIGD